MVRRAIRPRATPCPCKLGGRGELNADWRSTNNSMEISSSSKQEKPWKINTSSVLRKLTSMRATGPSTWSSPAAAGQREDHHGNHQPPKPPPIVYAEHVCSLAIAISLTSTSQWNISNNFLFTWDTKEWIRIGRLLSLLLPYFLLLPVALHVTLQVCFLEKYF